MWGRGALARVLSRARSPLSLSVRSIFSGSRAARRSRASRVARAQLRRARSRARAVARAGFRSRRLVSAFHDSLHAHGLQAATRDALVGAVHARACELLRETLARGENASRLARKYGADAAACAKYKQVRGARRGARDVAGAPGGRG